VKVRVGFEKLDPRILPDMSVKVAFQSAGSAGEAKTAQRVLSVPKSAVQQWNGRDVVWLIRDGTAERRAVTLGPADGDQVSIAAGLNGGEQVVLEGQDKLVDGARITGTESGTK